MLVLSRRPQEVIIIDGGRIRITVVDVRGEKVRLGIDAPPDTAVDRLEVHRAKQARGAAGGPDLPGD